jgi:Thin aggregative fimbriae synthesis protein
MRHFFLFTTLLCAAALAADYRIDPGASVRDGTLTVEPRVQGPAGASVRYEISTSREGRGGSSKSSQSGDAQLGSDGAARLARTSVNVSPQDRYFIQVRLLERGRVVAEETVRYPD